MRTQRLVVILEVEVQEPRLRNVSEDVRALLEERLLEPGPGVPPVRVREIREVFAYASAEWSGT